jgi:hypothetical protein
MGYKRPSEQKKLVGGVLKKRTLVIMGLLLLLFLFYPTIRNMATAYEAMVVEKFDGTVEYSTRKGALKHADFKEVILCDTKGKEFEKFVENAVFDKMKEGSFVEKKYMENQLKMMETVPSAEILKTYCKVHPPRPKPEPKKTAPADASTPPPPPPPEKPVLPAQPGGTGK